MRDSLDPRSERILNYLYGFVDLDIPEGEPYPPLSGRMIFKVVFNADETEIRPMLWKFEKLRKEGFIIEYRRQGEFYYRLTKKGIRYVEENI